MEFTIEKPCHENWDGMNSVSGGRFCDLCSKKVFDFTDKSKEEIDGILMDSGSICVRIKQPRNFILSKNFAYTFSVASILFASVLPNSFHAQKKVKDTIEEVIIMGMPIISGEGYKNGFRKTEYKKINGWVKSDLKATEKNVEVNLINLSTLYRINANNQGNFNLKITEDEYKKRLLFVSRQKDQPNRIYFNEFPNRDIEKIHLNLREEDSYLLYSQKIAKKESYFIDGEEVSYADFTDAIANTNAVEYFYIPVQFSRLIKPMETQTGIYVAYSKN